MSATRPFELICEIEPPTRPDLTHARHQIGVLSRVSDGFLVPDNHLGHLVAVSRYREVALRMEQDGWAHRR